MRMLRKSVISASVQFGFRFRLSDPPFTVSKSVIKRKRYRDQRGFDIGRVQSCPPPATKAGGTHSPGGEGGGGSIFWKTRDIGLGSYSNNLSTTETQRYCDTKVTDNFCWETDPRMFERRNENATPQTKTKRLSSDKGFKVIIIGLCVTGRHCQCHLMTQHAFAWRAEGDVRTGEFICTCDSKRGLHCVHNSQNTGSTLSNAPSNVELQLQPVLYPCSIPFAYDAHPSSTITYSGL